MHMSVRERPYNLKGRGMGFFLKKYSDSQCCWKKNSDFGGGKKKKSDSEFLSYNLMLISGKKKKNLTLVFWTKQRNHTSPPFKPPFKLNGRSLTSYRCVLLLPATFLINQIITSLTSSVKSFQTTCHGVIFGSISYFDEILYFSKIRNVIRFY
jgi:hypothetical protein